MPEQKQTALDFDWALFFYWLMATTFGWLLGWLVLPTIALVTAGIGAGIMQSVVLVRRMPHAWYWILATAVGWLAGVGIALAVVPPGVGLLSGTVIGATTGMAQWVLLRDRFRWAGWWIPVNIVAWAAGLGLAPPSGQVALPPLVLAGVMAAVPTGIALEVLLGNPKNVPGDKRRT